LNTPYRYSVELEVGNEEGGLERVFDGCVDVTRSETTASLIAQTQFYFSRGRAASLTIDVSLCPDILMN
jgi:hypothetical protein